MGGSIGGSGGDGGGGGGGIGGLSVAGRPLNKKDATKMKLRLRCRLVLGFEVM